jgi:hypothetical protein
MIVDNKIRNAKPDLTLPQQDEQLTCYAACHHATENRMPLVALDQFNTAPGKKAAAPELPDIRSISVRQPEQIQRWWRTVQAVHEAIRHQAFYPAPTVVGARANWVCTRDWCGYFDLCHQEF